MRADFYSGSHWRLGVLLFVVCLVPGVAAAHFQTDLIRAGFLAGLLHPVFGVDHLMAMVSVGIVSSLLGGINIFRIPAAFVSAMIVGGVLGVYQIPLPFGESGIAMSVIILGIGIVWAHRETGVAVAVVTVFVMFFGVFHGHAHGVEIPDAADPVFYSVGFVVSTTTLHIFGVIIGELSVRRQRMLVILRYVGAAMAGAGSMLLLRGLGLVV